MAPTATTIAQALRELRAFGLTFPASELRSPWPEHLDLVVRGKTFAFLPADGQPFTISCKLPESAAIALMLPGVEPTGYGLGRSGWVTARLPEGVEPPVAMYRDWIEESYRAQAPKKLVRALEESRGIASPMASPAKRAPAAKTAPAKKKRAPAKNAPAPKKPAARTKAPVAKNVPAAKRTSAKR